MLALLAPPESIVGVVLLIFAIMSCAALFGFAVAWVLKATETKTPKVARADPKLVETIIKEARHLPSPGEGVPGALPALLLYCRACNNRIDYSVEVGDRVAAASWINAFDLLSGAFIVYSSFLQTEE